MTTKGRARIVAALGFAVVALWLGVAPAAAQEESHDDESELERIKRDQARVVLRLESLREKMTRLADRYESEGRSRNATLLRQALERYDEASVLESGREVSRGLELGLLSTVESQDEVVAALEGVLAILKDRRDVDELAEQADLARLGAQELGQLAETQRRLLAETRAASDDPVRLTEDALESAEELQEALETTSSATDTQLDAQGELGIAGLADELARAQRELAQSDDPTAEEQAALEAALDVLRERLAEGVDGVSDEALRDLAERVRDAARGAADDAAEAMAAAREALAEAEAGDEGPSGEATSGEATSGEATSGEPGAGAEGDPTAGEPTGGEPTGGEPSGGEPSTGEPSTGDPSDGAPTGGEPSEGQPSGGEPSSGEPSGESSGSESSGSPSTSGGESSESEASGGQSSESSPGGSPGEPSGDSSADDEPRDEARERMTEAADALETVADALQQSERAMAAARNQARAESLAASRQATAEAERLEELAQRLEALDPEAGPELLDRTRELLAEAQRRQQAVESGQPGAVGSPPDLADLMEMLRQRAAQAEAEGDGESGTSQEQLDELARRQDDLAERTRELMSRLEELPDQQFSEAARRAQSAMDQASEALRRGDTQEAPTREEEAAEALEEAQRELEGAEQQYEELRQDEVLFQLGEELRALLDAQREVSSETLEIDAGRGDRDRLGRSERRAVVRLSNTERELSTTVGELHDAVSEDGAVSFTFALDRIRADLVEAAELLSDQETGFVVQAVQGDVIRRTTDLLAVLDDELERRRAASENAQPPDPNQQQQPPGPPRLVPPVAELLLLKSMEEMQLGRLERFMELNPQIREGRYTDTERDLLERWAIEHTEVAELFDQMIPSEPPAPEAEAPPGESAPDPEDER